MNEYQSLNCNVIVPLFDYAATPGYSVSPSKSEFVTKSSKAIDLPQSKLYGKS